MKKNLQLFLAILGFSFALAQAPAGYYDAANGLTGASLKTALSNIITNGHQNMGYSALWTAYATTDRDYFYENDGTILDIYSERATASDPYNYTLSTNQCSGSTPSAEGGCYNREHIIPQSLFGSADPMVADVHFIRPTDSKVNGWRADYPFGVVGTASLTTMNGSKLGTSASTGYSGTVFEPVDAFKGDVARMIFYFVTRYEGQLAGFATGNILGGSAFPGLQTWELQQLLIWNAIDPVSPAEIARNNASYTFQGNRNPFIDNVNYATQIWGTADSTAPSAPTNLVASNPTSSTIDLAWTASTDNVGVVAYDIYVNGVYHSTVTSTTATVSGLSSSTTYSFYVIAKDLAGNSSAASNTVSLATLAGSSSGSCGTENFELLPAYTGGYSTYTWTSNGITWTATDSRSDQTINTKAICIRNGALTSSTIANGVGSLTVTTQLKFTGSAGTFNLKINGNTVGTIPYSSTVATTTINNINVSGSVVISITDNSGSGNRVAFDDLSWTCYPNLSTSENALTNETQIYPNPVKNGILNVSGKDLSKVSKAEIYTTSGRLIQKINQPFKGGNQIQLKNQTKGIYILKIGDETHTFIVE